MLDLLLWSDPFQVNGNPDAGMTVENSLNGLT
jgi:hypothetical protein